MLGIPRSHQVAKSFRFPKIFKHFQSYLTPSGPGGGSEARMTKLPAANQKHLTLWSPNLGTFSFYPKPYQARGGGGGAQRPGWPNSQLTIRNLLFYDAKTWWLLVFILKAHSDQILAKFINQGVAAALSSSRRPQNFENEKTFLCLKIVEIDMGDQFWVEKNDSGHKSSFF